MSSILFDFSSVYENRNTYSVRSSTFFKYLDEHDIDFEEYVHNTFSSYKEFFVSCASLNRDSIKVDGKEVYKNYFFRPKSEDKREVLLRGDIEISANGGCFKVLDIYVVDNTAKKNFEAKLNISILARLEVKPNMGDVVTLRNLISSIPSVGKDVALEFVNKWDNYLEFERNFFLDQMGYYKTLGFQIVSLYEIKRTVDNLNKYSDSLYYDDGSAYLYLLKEDAGYIPDANRVECIEFEVELESLEERGKLASFINNEIEIAAPMEALDEFGNLRFGTNTLEFMFRTKRLGGVLKPLELVEEDKLVYRFSKFWVDDVDNALGDVDRIEERIETFYSSTPLLVNVLSGDLALYKRGKQALKDIKEGNVKNPALINYLLNIDLDENDKDNISIEDIQWSNPYLDNYQKKAICEALSTRNIFLIQGPPGTGKTQVISELVYQLNKRNKKVLLSSQTHVAIDNALERLPDELDILPIRLINQERKVKFAQDYLPDRLVDNLYSRIRSKYSDRVNNFDVYADKVLKYRKDFDDIKNIVNDRRDIFDRYFDLNKSINGLKAKLIVIDNNIVSLNVEKNNIKEVTEFLCWHKDNSYNIVDYGKRVSLVYFKDVEVMIDKYKEEISFDSDNLNDYFKLLSTNDKFKKEYRSIVNDKWIESKIKELEKREVSIDNGINVEVNNKNAINKELDQLVKSKSVLYKSNKSVIDRVVSYCDGYIDDDANSVPLSLDEKIDYIETIIVRAEKQFKLDKEKLEKYRDIYEDCLSFFNNKEDMDDDRVMYSKYLLDNNANVYGITCNANSKYLEEKNEYLSMLGLGNVDLKNIDFDVTIIDEVSKATPIELLIPILYSKSIILVGDHRQLPPTFKYKENMLEYLSEQNKVSKLKLREYQEMVEASLFESLFSSIKHNKSMLVNQYRSHSQIVDVINTFYDGRLNVGNMLTQDEAKQHYLESSSNGFELFTPNVHTYWFNSHYDINGDVCYEKKLAKGSGISTSFYNDEELYLIEEILKNMDSGYDAVDRKNIPSIGIISLYGDQVRELKKRVSKLKFKNIDMNQSRVYTVDEFQGKEEDIIIVSLVRNNKNFRTGEFTKKYQRINVALSRARKMLVIVGSKEFFSTLDVEIPNMEDNSKVVKRKIYKEIYDKVIGKIDNPNEYFD